jgi:hypothetical protein
MKHILYEWQLPTPLERSIFRLVNGKSMCQQFLQSVCKTKINESADRSHHEFVYWASLIQSTASCHNFYRSVLTLQTSSHLRLCLPTESSHLILKQNFVRLSYLSQCDKFPHHLKPLHFITLMTHIEEYNYEPLVFVIFYSPSLLPYQGQIWNSPSILFSNTLKLCSLKVTDPVCHLT